MSLRFSAGIRNYDTRRHNRLMDEASLEAMEGANSARDELLQAGVRWKVELDRVELEQHEVRYVADFRLLSGEATSSALYLSLELRSWSTSHYLLLPGSVYAGNRFESRRIPYSPKLTDPSDIGPRKGIIISDIPRLDLHGGPSRIQERSGAMTVPVIGIFDPEEGCSSFLIVPTRGSHGDTGIQLEENRERTALKIRLLSPVVRELTQYRITDNQVPSTDLAAAYREGYHGSIRAHLLERHTPRLSDFYAAFFRIRQRWNGEKGPGSGLPFSHCFPLQERKFNRSNWVEDPGYYSVGMRENFLQDWQIGWTGGMISTFPLLCLGSPETKNRVVRNIDWVMRDGISPSGFFWDAGEKGTRWYGGDIRREHTRDWHLVRKSGDALFYLLKQFRWMESHRMEVTGYWKENLRKVAGCFVRLWEEEGQLGQFVHSLTGKVVVGGSTSGGIVPAALARASRYFSDQGLLETAGAIALHYYREYVSRGITCGGPGDALQCPDSESAYALLESFVTLYEYTREESWLERSKDMAHQFSSWVMAWNYPFPSSSTLGRLKILSRGSVGANAQNKHGAPGICTHSGSALLRLSVYSGDPAFGMLLKDIARALPQFLSHGERPIPGLEEGWMSERVSTTDWFEGIGEIMTGSTWAETALMLTCTELPGYYLDTRNHTLLCFDQPEGTIVEPGLAVFRNHTSKKVSLRILRDSDLPPQVTWPDDISEYCRVLHLAPGEEREYDY